MANFGKALRELTNMRDSLQAEMEKVQAQLQKVETAIEQLSALDAPAAAPRRAPRRKKAAAAAKTPAKAAKAPKAAKAAAKVAPKAAKAPAAATVAAAAPAAAAKKRSPSKRGYPKFARAGKKLVEVKWNAKKNGEQRHRMDFGTVSLFTKAINKNGDKLFRKNLLTEVTNKDGKRLPLHQVYSVLGWLLSNGSIVKKGRGDYLPKADKMAAAALRETFNALPDEGSERISSKKKAA